MLGMVQGVEFVEGRQLRIACERSGTNGGWPVVLLHGFPCDPRRYDEAASPRSGEPGVRAGH